MEIRWQIHLTLPALLVVVLFNTPVSATLTLLHGKITSTGVQITEVDGVVALNLGGTAMISHFLDCYNSQNTTDTLEWSKEEGTQRFPTSIFNSLNVSGVVRKVLRLNLAPTGSGGAIDHEDTGVYICTDTSTNSPQTISINVTGGSAAVCPVELTTEVIAGGTVDLRVYADGDPDLSSSEVRWRSPRGQLIRGDSRVSLHDTNKRLLVRQASLEDSGTYTVDIYRLITVANYRILADTTLDLDVHVGTTLVTSPTSTTVLEHESLTLACEFSGNPSPTIVWEREGSESLPLTRASIVPTSTMHDNYTLHTARSELRFRSVLYEDRGRYGCRSMNILTGDVVRSQTSTFAELDVTPRLQLTTDPTSLTISENGVLHVTDGTMLSIICEGSGRLHWESSTGTDIVVAQSSNPSENVYQINEQTLNAQTLTIRSFSSSEEAEYTCSTDIEINGNIVSTSVYITSDDPAVIAVDETVYAASDSTQELEFTVFTARQGTLNVAFFHQSMQLNPESDSRYSLSTSFPASGGRLYTLTVMNVAEDVLGQYRMVVTVEGVNATDSVLLAFPEPPTAEVSPSTITASENERVVFECVAGGTETFTVWTLAGSNELPNGARQDGSRLIFDQTNRHHAGMYQCSVTNVITTASAIATLTIIYPPTTTISRLETGQTAVSHIRVDAEDDGPALTISCSSDGSPSPTLSWGRSDGEDLPNGVTVVRNGERVDLQWNRPLDILDSGLYTCTGTNSNGSSSATLDLFVRQDPTFASLSANPGITRSSQSTFRVPLGYTGTVATCFGLGWPTPTIQWRRNGQSLGSTGDIQSQLSRTEDSPFVEARLRWNRGFADSDAGDYECIVQASENDTSSNPQSEVIMLVVGDSEPSSPSPCTVDTNEVLFQIRILDTDCSSWSADRQAIISRDFMELLVNIVSASCPQCSVNTGDIDLSHGPECSSEVTRAAVFRGIITTESASRTQDVFCTLSSWQQTGPLIQIDGQFHPVDSNCSAKLGSLDDAECTNPNDGFDLLPIMIAVPAGVAVLLILVLCTCICCCCLYYNKKRKSGSVDIFSAKNGCQNYTYERTCHSPRSDIAMTSRYTDRVNPESVRAPAGSTADEDNHVYSTLDRNNLGGLPPPPPMVHPMETSFNRKDSRAYLIEDVDGKSASPLPFPPIPEPYQMAVSSREQLDTVGISERPEPSHTIMSSGSGSSHPSLTGVGVSGPYEAIAKHYGPREFSISSSSPKLPSRQPQTPLRKTVSGPFAKAKHHPGSFKRHMSAIEDKFREPGTDEDYSHLDHSLPSTPTSSQPPSATRKGQSASFAMMTPSPIVTTAQSVHHLHNQPRPDRNSINKRSSVTNYTRNSQSPTDSHDSTSFSMRNQQTFTPTSEGPPPYESGSSPFSPSDHSSMMDNGAYDSVVYPQEQPQPDRMQNIPEGYHEKRLDSTMSDESLSKNQPWYRNASDLNNQPADVAMAGSVPSNQQRAPVSSNNITPYSQVSNVEIDSRRLEDSLRTRSPMFTINSDNVRMSFSPPEGGRGSLSRVPNPHLQQHAVVV